MGIFFSSVEAITPIASQVSPVASGFTPSKFDHLLLTTLGLALWFILCRHLSNEWAINPQYSYGWFVPLFVAYLFWLRWEDRPPTRAPARDRNPNHFLFIAAIFLLFLPLLPIRLFEIGNPDWRPLGWLHAALVVALTLLFIWRAGGPAWLKHFAFSVAFIFIAVPWISPIEEPIVQGLMRIVAAIASEAINLLGIPAQLEGSVIRISRGIVGVNEACSGVRSLQTSLMIGLLFGELKRLSFLRRIGLLTAALALAFVANCGRAFILVWIAATRNLDAVGQWHDIAGYAILAVVFLGTIGIANLLAREKEPAKGEVESRPGQNPVRLRIPTTYLGVALLWLLLVEAASETWYRLHERNLIVTPVWTVNWPEQEPGFREIKIDENVKATLRYDTGRQATWPISSKALDAPPAGSYSMFFFRWEPGTTSILRARAHRPDVCLPNTGWVVLADHGVTRYLTAKGVAMPFRHFAFGRPAAENRTASAHAFFCQHEDRMPSSEAEQFDANAGALSDWSRSDRVRVVREGLRNQGQQVLEVVILSPRPFDGATAEAEFAKLVPEIVR